MRSPLRSSWFGPRLALMLGALGCALCCGAPLVALVVGAGAASVIAGIAEPIAGALLAVAAVLGVARLIGRRRAGCACGCGAGRPCTLAPTG
jgi:hypothetical protein